MHITDYFTWFSLGLLCGQPNVCRKTFAGYGSHDAGTIWLFTGHHAGALEYVGPGGLSYMAIKLERQLHEAEELDGEPADQAAARASQLNDSTSVTPLRSNSTSASQSLRQTA